MTSKLCSKRIGGSCRSSIASGCLCLKRFAYTVRCHALAIIDYGAESDTKDVFFVRELFEGSPLLFPCFASVVVPFIFAFVCLPCVGFLMQRMPMMGMVLLIMIADIRPTNHTGSFL